MNMEVNGCPKKYNRAEINMKIDRNPYEQINLSQESNTTVLYPDVLVKIFSYLNERDLCNVALVCKRWKEVAYYKCLWQNTEVKVSKESNSFLIPSLAQRGIKQLHYWSPEKDLPELAMVLPNLILLSLKVCSNFSDSSIFEVFSNYTPNLVVLDLSFCEQLTDNAASQIVLNCKNLISLTLDDCKHITDHSLMLIACGLKELRVLSLRACDAITDVGIKHIAGHSSNPSSDGNPLLEILDLQECTQITEAALRYLSNGFMKHLRIINLIYCIGIANFGLKRLSNNSLYKRKFVGYSKLICVCIDDLLEGNFEVPIPDFSLSDDAPGAQIMCVSAQCYSVSVEHHVPDSLLGEQSVATKIEHYFELIDKGRRRRIASHTLINRGSTKGVICSIFQYIRDRIKLQSIDIKS